MTSDRSDIEMNTNSSESFLSTMEFPIDGHVGVMHPSGGYSSLMHPEDSDEEMAEMFDFQNVAGLNQLLNAVANNSPAKSEDIFSSPENEPARLNASHTAVSLNAPSVFNIMSPSELVFILNSENVSPNGSNNAQFSPMNENQNLKINSNVSSPKLPAFQLANQNPLTETPLGGKENMNINSSLAGSSLLRNSIERECNSTSLRRRIQFDRFSTPPQANEGLFFTFYQIHMPKS